MERLPRKILFYALAKALDDENIIDFLKSAASLMAENSSGALPNGGDIN